MSQKVSINGRTNSFQNNLVRYRNIKIRITDKNYKKIITWFKEVDPGSFIDFFIINDKDSDENFFLWNQSGDLLKLNNEEVFIAEDAYSKGVNVSQLFCSINQEYDLDNHVSNERIENFSDYNDRAWSYFAESVFFARCVDDPEYYPNYTGYSRHARVDIDILEAYIDYIFAISDDIRNDLPSKLFIMGDIGIYKVEKNSIVISFDIKVNINDSNDFFLNSLCEYDKNTDIKPFEYRKAFLEYLYSAISEIGSVGDDYRYMEFPIFPRINKFVRLLYMYFSAKSIFNFAMVDDLTMLNIYKRENLSKNDIIVNDPQRGEIFRGNSVAPSCDMRDENKIVPEDIMYPIDNPLDQAELMTLLGKYSDDKNDYDNRVIALCLINIERSARHLSETINLPYYDYDTVRSILIKKVFYHEMGHMIFRKISSRQKREEKEKTANWVACLSYDKDDVEHIRKITYELCRKQTESYHNPIFIPNFMNISADKYNDYCREVNKLLEK